MRVAYYSPLPPQRSGIADYSAELLPELARRCELVLVVEDGASPDPGVTCGLPVVAARRLPELLASGRCDVALYQLGNNHEYHGAIYRAVLAHPGLTVLHEVVLHHMVRELTLYAGDAAGYVEQLRYCYGRSGEAAARRALATGVPLDPWSYPLFERVADASRGLVVHNRYTADRVRRSRPNARVVLVPHLLSPVELPVTSPAEARARLGLPADGLLVATFGFVTAAKRIDVLLRAFARLRREVPAARLLLVGEVSRHFDLARVLTPELSAGVVLAGRPELDRFLLHMMACDVAVSLRHPTAGETSGAVMRLLGLGKPLVVSRTGAFAEVPDGCCAKVEVGDGEEDLLLAILRALAVDPDLRLAMGANARRYMASHHSLASAADRYAEALRRCLEERWWPPPAPPPLAPYSPADLTADLVRDLAAEVTDLGLGEDDEALPELARALVELGLDSTASGRLE